MTIALIAHPAHRTGPFARIAATVRAATARVPARRVESAITVNEDRWATLPGEYTGPWVRPLDRTLPPITASGTTEAIDCAGYGPVILHLAGSWSGRVVCEGTSDGATWFPVSLAPFDGGPTAAEATRPALWRTLPDRYVRSFRLHSTHLSGAIHATVAATSAFDTEQLTTLETAA